MGTRFHLIPNIVDSVWSTIRLQQQVGLKDRKRYKHTKVSEKVIKAGKETEERTKNKRAKRKLSSRKGYRSQNHRCSYILLIIHGIRAEDFPQGSAPHQ